MENFVVKTKDGKILSNPKLKVAPIKPQIYDWAAEEQEQSSSSEEQPTSEVTAPKTNAFIAPETRPDRNWLYSYQMGALMTASIVVVHLTDIHL